MAARAEQVRIRAIRAIRGQNTYSFCFTCLDFLVFKLVLIFNSQFFRGGHPDLISVAKLRIQNFSIPDTDKE